MGKIKLRLVVPAYNEGEMIDRCSHMLLNIIDDLSSRDIIANESDVFFVDDGSVDDTWYRITTISQLDPRIKGIRLSTNVGHQVALKAGLDCAVGNCDLAISIDADLQQDPLVISDFIRSYQNGADIIYGVRKDRETDGLFKSLTAMFFYKFAALLGIELVPGHADYRGLSNKALKHLASYKEKVPFLRGIIPSMGFKSDIVKFDVSERKYGKSKYTIKKMVSFGLLGITSFSIFPLRLFGLIGAVIITSCFLMLFYIIYSVIFTSNVVPGWASTLIPIYFLGGIQLLGVSVLGEYVGKTFLEVKDRPSYIIESEL